MCRVKSCTQGVDADQKRRKLVACSERITPHDIRDYAVLRRNGNTEANVLLGRSAAAQHGSQNKRGPMKTGQMHTIPTFP